jgi:hypothetical protein
LSCPGKDLAERIGKHANREEEEEDEQEDDMTLVMLFVLFLGLLLSI